jgi:hypothetical protein
MDIKLTKSTILGVSKTHKGFNFRLSTGECRWVKSADAVRRLATSFGISSNREGYEGDLVRREIYWEDNAYEEIVRFAPASVIDGAGWIDAAKEDPVPEVDEDGADRVELDGLNGKIETD